MAEHANYQGEHLGLSLNRDALFALNDALEQLRYSVSDRGSAAVPLRLPDGRTLQLRLSLTNAGEIRDEHGDYLDDDGIAHGDVTGDLGVHAEVRAVLDAVGRQDLFWDLSAEQRAGDEPVDLDEVTARRIEAALTQLPHRSGRTDEWVEQLRARVLDHARGQLSGALARERRAVVRERERDASPVNAPGQGPVLDSPEQSPGEGSESEGRPGKFEASPEAEALYAETPDAEDRYAYRGSVVAGAELVERLVADGLASPAARDMTVDEVVWQVTEGNAVDWNDPVDVHDFPRKLSSVDPDEPVGRGDEQAVSRPMVRLRNRFDDDRRAEVGQARQRRGYAATAAADGRDSHAGYWAGQADRWDQYAQPSASPAPEPTTGQGWRGRTAGRVRPRCRRGSRLQGSTPGRPTPTTRAARLGRTAGRAAPGWRCDLAAPRPPPRS